MEGQKEGLEGGFGSGIRGRAGIVSARYDTVQALRFIAAGAVVALHATFYTFERLDSSLGLYTPGANGVRLFFVISGFVMIMSTDRLRDMPGGWLRFATKRIARIVPLYWAVTLVKLVMLLAVPSVVLHARFDWLVALCSFLFIPAYNTEGVIQPLIAVGWTLNIEMFFYMLFTLALACRIRPTLFIAPIFLFLTVASAFKTRGWPAPAFLYCDPVILDFLAGMLIARWLQRGGRLPKLLAATLLAAGMFVLFRPHPKAYELTLGESLLVTLTSACVVLGAVSLETVLAKRIPRWMLYLGATSYSLYLVHPLVAPLPPTLLAKLGLPYPLLSIGLCVVVALLAGIAVFHFFEKPVTHFVATCAGGWIERKWSEQDRSPVQN